jgi:menaquinone-9 beta-reductase
LTGTNTYDVAVIGGGLAGLSLAIQMAKTGFTVIVFEKEKYPFHKVCGEYISLESWNFLEELGLPLSDMGLPIIKRLIISAPNGNYIEQDLSLGGFGISRYKIEAALAEIAVSLGVSVCEETKVADIVFGKTVSAIQCGTCEYYAKIVCGTYGKRSNLDVKFGRSFLSRKNNKLNNYIGVKYHIESEFPDDLIALHNFKDGYCGISRIEDHKYCLCYLTTAKNLQVSGNSIKKLEENILQDNPFLKQIFSVSRILFSQPLTISQISFSKKTLVEDHVLMIGDAAGTIAPLCGNGMSMAMHGSKLAGGFISQFLNNRIARHEMEQGYSDAWRKIFRKRMLAGRIIQRFFGNDLLSNILLKSVKPFPKLVSFLIRQTHGEPY